MKRFFKSLNITQLSKNLNLDTLKLRGILNRHFKRKRTYSKIFKKNNQNKKSEIKLLKKESINSGKNEKLFGFYKRVKDISISAKITSLVSLMVIIIMIVSSGVIYKITYKKMLDMNDYSMNLILNEIGENFNNLMNIQTSDIDKISLDSSILDIAEKRNSTTREEFYTLYKKDIEKVNQKLIKYSNAMPNTEQVFITDAEGVIALTSEEEFKNNSIGLKKYYQDAMSGKNGMSEVYTSTFSAKPVITIIKAIKDERGEIIGTIGKSIYTDYFSQRLDSFKYLEKGFIFIVDNSGNVIYHPDKYYINKKLGIEEINMALGSGDLFKSKSTQKINYMKDKGKYTASYITIPELQSVIFLTIGQDAVKEGPQLIGLIIFVVALIIIGLMIPVTYFGIKKIFKPMKVLIDNTVEISKGNLKVENLAEGKDEVGQLSSGFNRMSANIKELLLEIKHVSEKIVSIKDVIKGAQEETTAGMQIINKNYEGIIKDTDQVEKSMQWSFNAFENILNKTNSIKRQSEDMLNRVDKMRFINEQGIRIITNLQDINRKSTEKIGLVNESFDEFKGRLVDINNIIGLVNNISKQTHILSLNASIEASRAGEYGLGFKVVAQEMGKLSGSIEDQMKRVEDIIGAIFGKMDDINKALSVVNNVSNNQSEIVNNTIDSFGGISVSFGEILNYIKNSNDALDALSLENKSISMSFKNVNNLTSNFNNSVVEINDVIENQSTRTNDMNGFLLELESTVKELEGKMSKFKV